MTEKNPESYTEIKLASEEDMTPEDHEADAIKSAWNNLFSSLLIASKREGCPADETSFESCIFTDNKGKSYSLRVHGSFIDNDGQPTVINVDVYKGNLHTQRAAGLAKWENEIPEAIDINNDQMVYEARRFNLQELAEQAEIIVSERGIEIDKSTGLPKNAIFPIPDTYLDSIH